MPDSTVTVASSENGKLPASALASIPGGELSKEAAAAWNAPGGPASAGLMPGGPDSSYRTYDKQVYYWELYQSGQGNEAAEPGTSNHGWGTAVDLAESWMRDWIDAHGAKYGWKKTEAFSEWWHVNYIGGTNFPTGKDGVETPTTPKGPVEVGGVSAAEVESISKGSALAAYLNLPGLGESFESLALVGERSLMNDKPLLSFVEQMCQASLRNFMSMPDGSFFAWLPDYFGGLTERTPYWSIDDTEIISGSMELSDDALATHVYVVGDTGTIDQAADLFEKWQTAGVVTVFNAFQADFITGYGSGNNKAAKKAPILAEKSAAIDFLEKYGARPYYQEAPMIRSHYFEMFLAYQTFCLLWSQQFSTKFEFTFMPELFPGGIVEFPEHGIQCYVQEVRHEGSYESGFRTIAELTAPSALPNGPEGVHDGMVRADVFNPQTIEEYAHDGGRGNRGAGPRNKRE